MTTTATVAPSWEELVATALVGTERRPLPPATPRDGGTDAIALAAAGARQEGGLLAAAAVLVAVRQTGAAPPAAAAGTVEPAPDDARPLPSEKAVDALTAILEDPQYRRILPEWLRLAEAGGRRAPPDLVPALLDTVRGAGAATRASAVRVAGPLAPWLASRNPAWSWVARLPVTPEAAAAEEPAAAGEAEAAGALAEHGLAPESIAVLEQLADRWSPALSERVVEALVAQVALPGAGSATPVRAALPMLAICLHPGVADDTVARLAAVLAEAPPRDVPAAAAKAIEKARAYWRSALGRFLSLLSFRKAMHEEMG